MKRTHSLSLLDLIEIIVKWRQPIWKIIVCITVTIMIISLLLTEKYTSTATILPPNPQQYALLGALTSSIPGGIGNMSGIGSFLPGIATPSDLYAAILKSGKIKGTIINKYDLMNVFKVNKAYKAYKMLADITAIKITPEGIIAVSVTYQDRELAAAIANSYIAELDKFNTETAMTVGKRYRIFIEDRLQDNIDSLSQAEDDLRKFQEKHRSVALDIEMEKAIETMVKLKGQIILLEVKRGALASASQWDNPHLYSIDKELRELKKQLNLIENGAVEQNTNNFGVGFSIPLSALPEVSLEYVRLVRNVKIQETIYELLTEQYEQAKIMESKDTPTLQILDHATPPERKSYPKRLKFTVIGFMFGAFVGIGYAFIQEYVSRIKNDKEATRWLGISHTIKSDIKQLHNTLRKLISK
jgi:uncharacterized protein involved in exopolysaccharide biosynthesis